MPAAQAAISSAAMQALSSADDLTHRRLVAFFTPLVGAQKAAAAAAIVLNPDIETGALVAAVAQAPETHGLVKYFRTQNFEAVTPMPARPEYVGLTGYDAEAPFAQNFQTHFAPRLAHRAEGFAAMFRAMEEGGLPPVIVETGCLRQPGNWPGDGQSTFMFDAFARAHGGWVYSIDINPEAVDSARAACGKNTQMIVGDSVSALQALAATARGPVALLYLDSFDLGADPTPSAIHHALELAAARPLLGPGSLVAVDDFGLGGKGGKGMIVDDYFARSSAQVLYSGYQKVWRIR